jgi:hypothetical protein
VFFDGEDRHTVEGGSFLFVAAGQPHRFEDFSTDFAVWVFFYGPSGGEVEPNPSLHPTPPASLTRRSRRG